MDDQVWKHADFWHAYIDDLWRPELVRAFHPNGEFELIAGSWGWYHNEPATWVSGTQYLATYPTSRGYPPLRPDDVFVQCGIQFRLASVIVVEETNPRGVFFRTSAGEPICNTDAITQEGVLDSWASLARDEPLEVLYGAFNSNAVTLEIAWRVANDDCLGFQLGAGKRKLAAFAVGQYFFGWQDTLTITHELGHALGMDDLYAPICSTEHKNLMCEAADYNSTHIPGCQVRDGQGLATLPINCVPDVAEIVTPSTSCDAARQEAASISQAAQQPISFEPGPGGVLGWIPSSGILDFAYDTFTEGSASLQVAPSGWTVVSSEAFRTADWLTLGTALAMDVHIDSAQPNPYWVGSLDVSIDVPAMGLYSEYLGHVELTGLEQDEWSTVEVAMPANVRQALLGDHPGGVLHIAVNTPEGAPPLLLDNLRFSGEVIDRTVFHQGPLEGGLTSPLFSFETIEDWTSEADNLSPEAALVTQGSAALAVDGSGYTFIQSRLFNGVTEVGAPTGLVTVDLFVPDPQPNPYWVGALQLYFTCPTHGLFNEYVGQTELTHLFFGEFNTLSFPLPSNVLDALSDESAGCGLALALNVNNGAGRFVLDNLAFR